jgi:hypothetical protein
VLISANAAAILKHPTRIAVLLVAVLLTWEVSCGGGDVCHCTPTASDSQDFRHTEKHVPLTTATAVETTIGQILGWPPGPDPSDSTPRTGRELTLYHISQAYLQNARLISFDCDIHLEISDVADKTAPRVIVETPIDSEYCQSRRAIEDGLARHHFRLRYVSNANVS